MTLALWLGVAGGAVALHLICRIWLALRSPLLGVPGPWLARFSDLWYLKTLLGKRQFATISRELHQQHGAIIRYGRNRYIIDDPDAAKIIYSFTTQFQKSAWYSTFTTPGVSHLFMERDVKRHAASRKVFQNTYSMSSLVSYEPYVRICGDLLGQHLTEFANVKSTTNGGRPTPLDLTHWLQCYAFDVISGVTFGKRIGFLDAMQDVGGLMALLDYATYSSARMGIYASMRQLLMPLSNKLASWRGLTPDELIEFIVGQVQQHCGGGGGTGNTKPSTYEIEDGLRGTTVQDPFVAKFSRRHLEDSESMPMHQIISACIGNILAGSDTTAISLSACMFYLLKNSACLQELRREVDAIHNTSEVADDRGYISFGTAQKMPYLQAVIKEALRLHPAVALPLERVVPVGGATISGTFFPEGTTVGINPWVQHRNKALFGHDADEFRPSRWLSEDTEKVALMNRSWMPFGQGTRTCIGRHVSHLEISTLIPRLVRDFDFQLAGKLAEPGASCDIDNGWFAKQRGFMVTVELRK
ncbi:cytochrome P450 [Microdochium trichocladiopsis]|uniref:Cytochrome P450 n=1 Tax=Microdochium trichocladiopsis TaxID=1682393 RepID=A0A9P8XT08_9PEZI|nr:cytochrome P450 [Microdochium trichocladiopsis]KAH7016408.1 cytochrome P450 [Microdochium trichocladiopsis]